MMAQNKQLLATLIAAISQNALALGAQGVQRAALTAAISTTTATLGLANTVEPTPLQSPPMAIEPKLVEISELEIEPEQVELTEPTEPRQVELNGLDITMEIEPKQVELRGLVEPKPKVERLLEPEEVITPDSNLGMWLQVLLVEISKPEGWAIAIGVLRPSGPGPPMDEPLPVARLQKLRALVLNTDGAMAKHAKIKETTTGSTVGGVGGV